MLISLGHIIFANGVISLNTIYALSLTNPNNRILLGQSIYGSFNSDLCIHSSC
jgi:xeroderma pigmentosum group C-complementing protein